MITNIDELAKYGNTKIEIIKGLHRKKTVEDFKEDRKQRKLQSEQMLEMLKTALYNSQN